jgi:hypothetical protein
MPTEFVKSNDEVVFSTRTAEEENVQRELDRIESDRAEFDFECARLWECM